MLDILSGQLNLISILACTGVSLLMGLVIAVIYMFKNSYTKSFAVTLVLLPAMVQVVIMLVNGNIGTGVAVAGAFGLVRFRSAPGNARDISSIFFAMAIGLATGMGYLLYAVIFTVIIGIANIVLFSTSFAGENQLSRVLKITIPENLDYEGLFDDLFEQYTESAVLEQIKTTNMGSLYELKYEIKLKSSSVPKVFMDELRCRNGNLNILIGRQDMNKDGL